LAQTHIVNFCFRLIHLGFFLSFALILARFAFKAYRGYTYLHDNRGQSHDFASGNAAHRPAGYGMCATWHDNDRCGACLL
jgi:hypothetical protein